MGKPEDHVLEIMLSSLLPSPPYVSVIESVQSPFFKPWKKKTNKQKRGEPSSNPWEQPCFSRGLQPLHTQTVTAEWDKSVETQTIPLQQKKLQVIATNEWRSLEELGWLSYAWLHDTIPSEEPEY